jgi:hypothetical protein
MFAKYRKEGLTNVTKLKEHDTDFSHKNGAQAAFLFGPVFCLYYIIIYLFGIPFYATQSLASKQSLAIEKDELRRKAIEQQQEDMNSQLESMRQEALKELESRDSVGRILGIQEIQNKSSIVSR